MKSLLMVWFSLLVCGAALGALDDGLICYFPFDGDSLDYSGNGNDATLHNRGFLTVLEI